MEKSQLALLGLYPLKGATQEDFERMIAHAMLRFSSFKTVEKIREVIERQGIAEEDVYLTTGLYDIILFDGKWGFMEHNDFPGIDIADQWEQLKLHLKHLEQEGEYELLMTYVPKAYKKTIIECHLHEIPEQFKRRLLIDIRSSSEYQFEDFDEEIFVPEMLKTKDGAEDLRELKAKHPEEVLTIYRGETPRSTELYFALSWTTDLYYAKFFANRFGSDGIIYKAEVPFEKILAYAPRESEVLVQYDDLLHVDEYEGNGSEKFINSLHLER